MMCANQQAYYDAITESTKAGNFGGIEQHLHKVVALSEAAVSDDERHRIFV